MREIGDIRRAMKMFALIECEDCGTERREEMTHCNLLDFRFDFAKTAWKHGWIVESGIVLCQDCQEDEQ